MPRAQIVSFRCVLKDRIGKVISTTFNHEVINQMEGAPPADHVLHALAAVMQDLKSGDKRRACLTASEAYGFYDPGLVMEVSRSKIECGEAVQPGTEILAQTQSGEYKQFRVTHATQRTLTLDANHPLAGQDLVFEIEATAVRYATAEEIRDSRQEVPSNSGRLLH